MQAGGPRHGIAVLRRSAVFLAAGILLASPFAGCGNIAIPATNDGGPNNNNGDAGDDGPGNEGGNGGNDAGGNDAAPPVDCTSDAGALSLLCTGLYQDLNALTIAPDAKAYDPGLKMWADNATTQRWMYLPPPSPTLNIDATDPNEWIFPIGTKVWQQFSIASQRIETRYYYKLGANFWFSATYAWNAAETDATSITNGQVNARGLGYNIPSTAQCNTCHMGRTDRILGFEAVSLASSGASGLTLQALKAMNPSPFKNPPPGNNPVIPSASDAGDAVTQAALGYLHVNCGTSCHNASASANAEPTGNFLRLELDANWNLPATASATTAWTTSVNVHSTWQPSGQTTFDRITPANPSLSAIPYRMGRRNSTDAMPSLGSSLVDNAGVTTINNWINIIP